MPWTYREDVLRNLIHILENVFLNYCRRLGLYVIEPTDIRGYKCSVFAYSNKPFSEGSLTISVGPWFECPVSLSSIVPLYSESY